VNSSLLKFVSRGGFKLEGALSRAGILAKDRLCIDVGQSTGGFTDCLLQQGSSRVLGIEVGEGQLHERLRHDERVVCLEKLHVNSASDDPRVRAFLGEKIKFDLLVADLSFISLAKVIDDFARLADEYLILVKPQFELGPAALDRRGLVKDPALYVKLEADLISMARTKGWKVCDYFESCIQGKDGNIEFFMHAVTSSRRTSSI
jgi:23S rRNA (cytidine1920-2'-O)/16S rRNA (cytidine1409-2'-O)-methyltransferase